MTDERKAEIRANLVKFQALSGPTVNLWINAPQDIAELLADNDRLNALKELMLSALRSVRSNRPSAHSDEVWAELNAAINEAQK